MAPIHPKHRGPNKFERVFTLFILLAILVLVFYTIKEAL